MRSLALFTSISLCNNNHFSQHPFIYQELSLKSHLRLPFLLNLLLDTSILFIVILKDTISVVTLNSLSLL